MLGFSSICQTAFAQKNNLSTKTILVLGDSISAEYGIPRNTGWVSLMRNRLASDNRSYQVINASISGETSSGGKQRITDLLKVHHPHILIVELGGNDGLRGLSLEQSQANLEFIVQEAKKNQSKILLLGMKIPPNYGKEYAQKFETMYLNLSKRNKVPLLPFFLERIATNPEMFQSDRIHPTEKAQPILLETVWPSLARLL